MWVDETYFDRYKVSQIKISYQILILILCSSVHSTQNQEEDLTSWS